jgi:hypothetical protein
VPYELDVCSSLASAMGGRVGLLFVALLHPGLKLDNVSAYPSS